MCIRDRDTDDRTGPGVGAGLVPARPAPACGRRGDRVCDLGCGAGALLLLVAARVSPLALSGVEYCPEDAALARRNLSENGLEGAIYTGDLRAVCKRCV